MPKKQPKAKNQDGAAPGKPKSGLTSAELKAFRAILLHRQRILRGDVGTMESESLKKNQDGVGDTSSVPLHLADLGSDAFEQEMTLGIMETESDELEEIEEALSRIQDRSFGLCENCSKAIPKARLKAIPYARYCIPCKKKEEG